MRVRLRPCLLTSAMFPKSGDPSARCQTSSPGCRAAPVPNATCQPPFSVRAMRDPTLGCSSLCRAASPGENLGSGLPAPQGTASPATARWVARCQSPSDLGRWWHRGWCRVGFSIVTETPWPGLAGRLGVNLRGCPQCPQFGPSLQSHGGGEERGPVPRFWPVGIHCFVHVQLGAVVPASLRYGATKPCGPARNCIHLVLPDAVFYPSDFFSSPFPRRAGIATCCIPIRPFSPDFSLSSHPFPRPLSPPCAKKIKIKTVIQAFRSTRQLLRSTERLARGCETLQSPPQRDTA